MCNVTLSLAMRRHLLISRFASFALYLVILLSSEIFSYEQTPGDNAKEYSWKTVLAPKDEPGEPLIVSGTAYGADGKTPLPGVLIYVYHTDAEGYYRKGSNSSDNPRLKGWMKTNAEGKYEFRTIKPGSYPGSRNPAHIHAKVTVPGHAEQWIDEFHFEGDPFLDEREVKRESAKGRFSSVMSMQRGADGVIRCVRDIKLDAK
jgi:protocatechuate 3,4-dioxygenase beta subunit